MALLNIPVPVPSVVLVNKAMVGFAVKLQQTPRVVMLPPLVAVVMVMAVVEAVVIVANAVDVLVLVKLISLP